MKSIIQFFYRSQSTPEISFVRPSIAQFRDLVLCLQPTNLLYNLHCLMRLEGALREYYNNHSFYSYAWLDDSIKLILSNVSNANVKKRADNLL